jgi:hypothetical protein
VALNGAADNGSATPKSNPPVTAAKLLRSERANDAAGDPARLGPCGRDHLIAGDDGKLEISRSAIRDEKFSSVQFKITRNL